MDCRVDSTASTDTLYLVKRKEFMRCVDRNDLACRESDIVLNVYLADWFFGANGQTHFYLPVFYLMEGRAFFVNGRHRTMLLSRFLDLLPMALAQAPLIPIGPNSQSVLQRLVHRELTRGEMIVLPDLPIVSEIK